MELNARVRVSIMLGARVLRITAGRVARGRGESALHEGVQWLHVGVRAVRLASEDELHCK